MLRRKGTGRLETDSSPNRFPPFVVVSETDWVRPSSVGDSDAGLRTGNRSPELGPSQCCLGPDVLDFGRDRGVSRKTLTTKRSPERSRRFLQDTSDGGPRTGRTPCAVDQRSTPTAFASSPDAGVIGTVSAHDSRRVSNIHETWMRSTVTRSTGCDGPIEWLSGDHLSRVIPRPVWR